MKFLVLSDIHGNNIALQAVLDKVKNQHYDRVLVLGDNIGDGPCPDKVLNILSQLQPVMIQGNREELACRHFAGFAETQKALQWQFMRESLSFMSRQQKEWIASFPQQQTITEEGLSLRMVHGSPFSIRELLYYNNPQRLQECLAAIKEPILLCGHNHYQFAYLNGDTLVMNPGSIGLSQKKEAFRADYALLNLSAGQFSFELNHVYYDGEKIKQEYMDRNLWDTNIWGQIAYKEMSEGKMYIIAFARFVFNLAKARNASSHPLDDAIWQEACETWDWTPAK